MAEEIHRALMMPKEARQERWRAMMDTLRRYDIAAWRENFLEALG